MKSQQTADQTSQKAVPRSKPVSTARKAKPPTDFKDVVSGDVRDELIRQTAYSFYEARSDLSGCELDDWLKAEAQVDQILGKNSRALDSRAQAA